MKRQTMHYGGGPMYGSVPSFFRRLFGFDEVQYDSTREGLEGIATIHPMAAAGGLQGHHPGCITTLPAPAEHCMFEPSGETRYDAGVFCEPSVAELRALVAQEVASCRASSPPLVSKGGDGGDQPAAPVCITVRNLVGEARSLHSNPEFANAVVQAASQFNYLEFPSPGCTPEHGIAGYEFDKTQGPACAIACAAGTAYRNYLLAPLLRGTGDEGRSPRGQQHNHQRNGLADMEVELANIVASAASAASDPSSSATSTSLAASTSGSPLGAGSATGAPLPPPLRSNKIFWRVKGGYIESAERLLNEARPYLTAPTSVDRLRSKLRIGLQVDTDVVSPRGRVVQQCTQVYCSAVSCGYSRCSNSAWAPLASLVLEGAYEATLLVGVWNALRATKEGRPAPPVLLTKVGGGVFGNYAEWIQGAIQRAVSSVREFDVPLDVLLVHYGEVEAGYEDAVVQRWAR